MAESKKSDPKTYSKPDVRDRIKKNVLAGDKGGDPGQWSARKAQLVTQEYEKEGGEYKKPRNESQKSLKQWGDEHAGEGKATKKTAKKASTKKPAAAKKKTASKKQTGQ